MKERGKKLAPSRYIFPVNRATPVLSALCRNAARKPLRAPFARYTYACNSVRPFFRLSVCSRVLDGVSTRRLGPVRAALFPELTAAQLPSLGVRLAAPRQ